MTDNSSPAPTPTPRATGCQLMACMFLGLIIGMFVQQPTLGFVIGFIVGITFMLVHFIIDKRRIGR